MLGELEDRTKQCVEVVGLGPNLAGNCPNENGGHPEGEKWLRSDPLTFVALGPDLSQRRADRPDGVSWCCVW